ncbi:FkbM family methyltransferase [Pseudoxanthobacter sp. M-2]|uniref:FkbM family methyltransferase n=1 Tax=Pseudoxanthobacter sp. M-2 TaxID=3078754 RepID=UPI0038FC91EE
MAKPKSDVSKKVPTIFKHVEARLPGFKFHTVLDVGANIGQSCLSFVEHLPDATIYSVEPVPETYAALCTAVASHPRIRTFNIALGDEPGEAQMAVAGTSAGNRIDGGTSPAESHLDVKVDTGDAFCSREQIDHVSFLKIDTEGYDLKVLRGFGDKIRDIDFIQIEVAMNDYNKLHVPFFEADQFLRSKGFLLFHIYAQAFEFHGGGRPVVRRANPVYINEKLASVETLPL